jgi:hypothetical protein
MTNLRRLAFLTPALALLTIGHVASAETALTNVAYSSPSTWSLILDPSVAQSGRQVAQIDASDANQSACVGMAKSILAAGASRAGSLGTQVYCLNPTSGEYIPFESL